MTIFSRNYRMPEGHACILDYIPSNQHRKILSRLTPDEDHTSSIQAMINQLGASPGYGGWLVDGNYGIASPLAISGKTGCHLRSSGYMSPNGQGGASLYAIADRIPDSTNFGAMLNVVDSRVVTVEGLAFFPGPYQGPVVRWTRNNFTRFCSNYIHSRSGVNQNVVVYTIASRSGNTLTLSSASGLVNGMRLDASFPVDGTSALPGGLAIETPYYVINKSGNTIQLSLTPGGSAVTLSSSGAGYRWLTYRGYHIDSVAITPTNTFTVEGHGYPNGLRVRSYNARQFSASGTLTVPFARALYVINATTNTFQLSDVPGGSVFSIAAAGATGRHIAPDYAAFMGGGNEYVLFENNIILSGAGSVYIQAYEDETGAYFGADNGSHVRNNRLSNASISGFCEIDGNDFGLPTAPDICSLFVGDYSSASSPKAHHNYFELGAPTPVLCSGIIVSGGVAEHNFVVGPGNEFTNTIGIFSNLHNGVQSFPNLNIVQRWGKGIYAVDPGVAGNPENAGGPLIAHNYFANNAVDQTIWPAAGYPDTDTSVRLGLVPDMGIGWRFDGMHMLTHRKITADSTTLNCALGPTFELQGTVAHTISTLTNLKPGMKGRLIAASSFTTLGSAAFETLSGVDYKMASGDLIEVCSNFAGTKYKLAQPRGCVVATTPAALAGTLTATVGDTNLFSAAPTVGKYSVDVYGTVLNQGTGTTTLTLPLKWTDAKAARTENMVTAFDLVAGATYFRARLSVSVASGNVTLGATFNTPTGTPQVTLDITVTRDS